MEQKSERKHEAIDWGGHVSKAEVKGKKPTAKYVAVSEKMRHTIPEDKQCKMFCGGTKCKYESADAWTDDEQAIKGLFSHWVTDNILAMARPNTKSIEKHNIIDQFKSAGIRSIINLQRPGEHSFCGQPLENKEFSYKQTDFMNNDIFFYNFGWRDYGVASLSTILDMVKVMQFAVSEGKVAIHCHAGLGRTGVLIACYLVFNNRMPFDEAIHYVRSRRPNAIQTRGQICCVQDFSQYLVPLRVVFTSVADNLHSVTLGGYLSRQAKVLHGFEARSLKFLPKIIHIISERLLQLAGKHGHPEETIKDNFSLIHTTLLDAFTNTTIQCQKSVHSVTSEQDVHTVQNGSRSTRRSLSMNSLKHKAIYDVRESDSGFESVESEGTSTSMSDSNDLNSNILSDVMEEADTNVLSVVNALLSECDDEEVQDKCLEYQKSVNADESTWDSIRGETNSQVLSSLLWCWLSELQEPILRAQDMGILEAHVEDPLKALDRLERGVKTTVEYLVKVMLRFGKLPENLEHSFVVRLISALIHQPLSEDDLTTLKGTKDGASLTDTQGTKRMTESGKLTSYKVSMLFTFFYNLVEVLTQKAVEQVLDKTKSSV